MQLSQSSSAMVTFLFTDIEGSTKLWEQFPEAMKTVLARHDALLREICEARRGQVFKTVGDAFYVAFDDPLAALNTAIEGQRVFAQEPWGETVIKVRMALHGGEVEMRDNDYFGQPLNRIARLLSAGHGGQVLLSTVIREQIEGALPPGITLRDMGERRLKDLIRPEHIFQLVIPGLPNDFPPLKTLEVFRTNLPTQLTSFIGREKEITELKKLLGQNRLVTLTGVGGTGKTRLALQVASTLLDDFPGGVWFIELAPVTNPELVPQTIASILELHELTGRSAAEAMADFLEKREVLLILDNCEHLIQTCAQLASHLLQSCPKLKIVTTSREPLGIAGETIWSVPSFSLPSSESAVTFEALLRFDAVRLFLDRARAVQPNFDLNQENARAVAQICTRLDGIPLALELAAARVRGMSVEQIAARLDSRFRLLTGGSRTALPRQQTLSALVDWSYNLLSEPEKLIFQRLSIFSGPFTLEASEQICSGEAIDEFEVLDLLQRLVDKSLVITVERHGESYYQLLETIRQYGRDKLLASETAELLTQRHAAYFLKVAEAADVELRGPRQLAWFHRLGFMRDNLRAALEWLIETEQSAEAFLFATKLNWFWFMRAEHSEGRQWLQRVLDLPDSGEYRPARIEALTQLGFHTWLQISTEKARPIVETALSTARAHDDRWNVAFALSVMGLIEENLGHPDVCQQLASESAVIFKELGDEWNYTHALFISAQTPELILETYRLFGKLGDRHLQFPPLLTLSYYQLQDKKLEAAALSLRQALEIAREFDNKVSIGLLFRNYAELALRSNQPARAVCLNWAARNILDLAAAWGEGADRTDADLEKWAIPCRTALGEAAFQEAVELGRSMSLEQAIQLALSG